MQSAISGAPSAPGSGPAHSGAGEAQARCSGCGSTSCKWRSLALAYAAPVPPLQNALRRTIRLLDQAVGQVAFHHKGNPVAVHYNVLGSSVAGYGVVDARYGIDCDIDMDWYFPRLPEVHPLAMRPDLGAPEYIAGVQRIAQHVGQYLQRNPTAGIRYVAPPAGEQVTRSFRLQVDGIEVEVFPKKYNTHGTTPLENGWTVSHYGPQMFSPTDDGRSGQNATIRSMRRTIDVDVHRLTSKQCAAILVKHFVKAAVRQCPDELARWQNLKSWFIAHVAETKIADDYECVGDAVVALWESLANRVASVCSGSPAFTRGASDDLHLGQFVPFGDSDPWTEDDVELMRRIDILACVRGLASVRG